MEASGRGGGGPKAGRELEDMLDQLQLQAEQVQAAAAELVVMIDDARGLVRSGLVAPSADNDADEEMEFLRRERDALLDQLERTRRDADQSLALAEERILTLEEQIKHHEAVVANLSGRLAETGRPSSKRSQPVIPRPIVEEAMGEDQASEEAHDRHSSARGDKGGAASGARDVILDDGDEIQLDFGPEDVEPEAADIRGSPTPTPAELEASGKKDRKSRPPPVKKRSKPAAEVAAAQKKAGAVKPFGRGLEDLLSSYLEEEE